LKDASPRQFNGKDNIKNDVDSVEWHVNAR
jgi:hypothetical protein